MPQRHLHFNFMPTTGQSAAPLLGVVNPELPLVRTAYLELAPLPLHRQIEQFGKEAMRFFGTGCAIALAPEAVAIAPGLNRLQIVPLFLLPGVHVMEDIPVEVGLARQALNSSLTLDIRPHLGAHPGLRRLLANQMNAVSADAWILLSHGSRRPGGNQSVEALATQLGAVSAYWSVPPSLEMRVSALVDAGHRQIGILPYFLFAGGIMDAIAQAVEQLSQTFPTVNFKLAEPLAASAELADLIVDLT